jgi:hypothetical protein
VVALIGSMLFAGDSISTKVGVHSMIEFQSNSSIDSSACQKNSSKNCAKLLKDSLALQISRANSI